MKKIICFILFIFSASVAGQTFTTQRLGVGANPFTTGTYGVFIRPSTTGYGAQPSLRFETNETENIHAFQIGIDILNQCYIRPSVSSLTESKLIIGDQNTRIVMGPGNFPTGFLLGVHGKIIAEELQVQLSQNWPDYVFEKNYSLLPINELEIYLEKNKHLPNIPSAEEVNKNNGILVGEMNAKLLEKIEELNLYIINLNKRIELLEKTSKQ